MNYDPNLTNSGRMARQVVRLSAAPASPQGEAVEWQFRYRLREREFWSDWETCRDPQAMLEKHAIFEVPCEVRPLYLAPPAPPEDARVRELSELLKKALQALDRIGVQEEKPHGTYFYSGMSDSDRANQLNAVNDYWKEIAFDAANDARDALEDIDAALAEREKSE